MNLNWNTLRSELPVLLFNHLSVHLLVLIQQLIQIDFWISILELLLLFSVSLLFLVDLY